MIWIFIYKICKVFKLVSLVFIVLLFVVNIVVINLEVWSRAFLRGGFRVFIVVSIGFIWGGNKNDERWLI